MKINQLSIFSENKPGHLLEPCRLLAREGINIRALSLADTQRFGILRIIVPEWERAKAVLIFRFNDPDAAQERLRAAGVNLLAKTELWEA